MLGAIAGDVIGSVYEASPIKTTEFPLFDPGCRFTDDTVLTVALADTLLSGGDYVDALHEYFHLYPDAGYGGTFYRWARAGCREPYNSWGNGSAMRVSPLAFVHETLAEVLDAAERSAAVTHSHPEGVKGAQAIAAAIFLARKQSSKDEIRVYVRRTFGYGLYVPLEQIRPSYRFDVSCQGSVPVAIMAFLESESYEDAVRKAISVGGDADTLACMAGGIAQAYYGGVPEAIATRTMDFLDERLSAVVLEFCHTFSCF
ncbi:MAG: ADP-ribosylglycohydrolase family protein [Actinomycetota bacterium]